MDKEKKIDELDISFSDQQQPCANGRYNVTRVLSMNQTNTGHYKYRVRLSCGESLMKIITISCLPIPAY